MLPWILPLITMTKDLLLNLTAMATTWLRNQPQYIVGCFLFFVLCSSCKSTYGKNICWPPILAHVWLFFLSKPEYVYKLYARKKLFAISVFDWRLPFSLGIWIKNHMLRAMRVRVWNTCSVRFVTELHLRQTNKNLTMPNSKVRIISGSELLKVECKSLPQTYFLNEDANWCRSVMVLNEKLSPSPPPSS